MNPADTLIALRVMFAAFPNTEWTQQTQTVYVDHLADIPVDELRTVIGQAIATCKFPPTIAEIRDTWHGIRNAGQLTWADAWDSVQKEMRRVGSYALPQFSDELTTRVVKAMGWKTLCASEDAGIDRAQFRDMYNAMAARQDGIAKLLPQARELAERSGSVGLLPIRNLLEAHTNGNGGK